MNGTGEKCGTCSQRNFRRVYGVQRENYKRCIECGSDVLNAYDVSGNTMQIHIDTPFIDENIDGIPRLITSRRKHKDLLKKHNLVCKHYM